MSALHRIPAKDLERLSAYLDGELAAREAARVEARLQREPALREALQTLRKTVDLVGVVPQLRPPRSFTLTPEMVGARPGRPGYPRLQLSTVLAALALFVVLGTDLLTRGVLESTPAAPTQAALESERAALEEAPPVAMEQPAAGLEFHAEAESALPTATRAPSATQPSPQPEALLAAEEQAEDAAERAAEARQPGSEPAQASQEQQDLLAGDEAGAGYLAGEEEHIPGTPAPMAQAPAAVAEAPQDLLEKAQQAPPLAESGPAISAQAPRPSGASARRTAFRLAEIVLGVVVIMLTAATLRARRLG